MNAFVLWLFWGLPVYLPKLGHISRTLNEQELERWAQASDFMTPCNNLPVSNFLSISAHALCHHQSLEVKGPFSHLSTPYFPSPTTPKLLLMFPLVPLSMHSLFTGKLTSFAKNCCCTIWQSVNFLVAWMFVRKQKLRGQNPKPFTSNSLEKMKRPKPVHFTSILSFKVLA